MCLCSCHCLALLGVCQQCMQTLHRFIDRGCQHAHCLVALACARVGAAFCCGDIRGAQGRHNDDHPRACGVVGKRNRAHSHVLHHADAKVLVAHAVQPNRCPAQTQCLLFCVDVLWHLATSSGPCTLPIMTRHTRCPCVVGVCQLQPVHDVQLHLVLLFVSELAN